MLDAGVRLTTVELAFGNRCHQVTSPNNPRHVQLRSDHELWHKENLINIGISRLPQDWRYVAWIDVDIVFSRPDWADETLHQLQHYHVVHMWSHAMDLCPKYRPMRKHYDRQTFCSWMYCFCNAIPPRGGKKVDPDTGYVEDIDGTYWHPGFAWAARRETIDRLGGLIDWAILGSADRHMACALVGHPHVSAGLDPS